MSRSLLGAVLAAFGFVALQRPPRQMTLAFCAEIASVVLFHEYVRAA
jgi:hypothetical protein